MRRWLCVTTNTENKTRLRRAEKIWTSFYTEVNKILFISTFKISLLFSISFQLLITDDFSVLFSQSLRTIRFKPKIEQPIRSHIPIAIPCNSMRAFTADMLKKDWGDSPS